MPQPTLLHALPPVFSPFGVECAQDEALASPFQHGGGGAVGITQLPYRHSLLPSHAADVPAEQLRQHHHHHHPTNASANHSASAHAYTNQRSSAALAAHRHAAVAAAAAGRSANAAAPNHPLQLSAATLRELQRRELLKRKRFRDAQDRDLRERERARARKLSRAAARASRQYGMEGGAAEFGMSEEELAQMQKLSNDYRPEVSGPEVSEPISTEAIAQEYARADPSYQVKAASIPQSYPLYRRCKGDGLCGWRAVGFCYYETLLYMNSKQKYREEDTRFRSLSNLLQALGYDISIYEEWEEEVLALLASLANSSSIKDAETLLLTKFNDANSWQSIITYFKSLTSAWICTRPEDYEPFMQGMTAKEYCGNHIDAYTAEIEHVGLSALVDWLLKPTGFAMEIHYLDRSAGNEAFVHRFDPADNTGANLPGTPVIRLLYRPGHYDILYAFSDMLVTSQQPALPASNGSQHPHGDNIVYLASPSDDSPHGLQSTPSSYTPFAEGIAMIPGLSNISTPTLGGSPGLWMAPPPSMTGQFPATPSYEYPARTIKVDYAQGVESQPAPARPPHSTPLAPQPQRTAATLETTYSHHAALPSTSAYAMPAPPTYIDANPSVFSHHSPHPAAAAAAPPIHRGSIDRSGGAFSASDSIFRPSRFEYESRWSEATLGGPNAHGRDLGFQTSIFRNSHFNIAHFNNPDFEPEQWQPGQESCEKARRKSMAH